MRRGVSAPKPEENPPQWDQLERLAREALEFLASGDSEDCARLREQLARCSFEEIDYTGAGFFLTLRVDEATQKLSQSGIIGDVHAEAPSGMAPLGTLLFVDDGRAATLEVFGYAEWPTELAPYRCRYVRWKPMSGTGKIAEHVAERDLASMWT